MPDPGQLKLDPYQSQIPILQLPQQDLQPGGPLPQQAGYMGKAGSGAAIGDSLVKGFLRGHEVAAQHKAQQANYAIDLSQKSEQGAWKNYSDALVTGQAKPGDDKDPAYQAYLKAHSATSETMEKYSIPEDKPKGQKKKDQKPKEGEPQQPQSFGQKIGDFLKANPHVIPQLAIASRTPNPPRMSPEMQQQQMGLQEGKNQLTMQGQSIRGSDQKFKEDQETQQRQAAERAVEEKGGVDKVLNDPAAPPELQQTAKRIKFTAIDKESPEGKIKLGIEQKIAAGQTDQMTLGEKQLAGAWGMLPQPKEVKMTGKNGHEMEILVDPTTNKPIPGSKPLDLGPPQWAQEFYGKRAAEKADLRKAVGEDPEGHGIALTGDKNTDDARIQAVADRMFTDHEEGIRAQVGNTGKTGYEVQRDNSILSDVAKEIKTRIPTDRRQDGSVVPGKAQFLWPGEKNPVTLSHEDASRILEQFVTDPNETPGVYGFRSTPKIQSGKDAGAAERDRQWAYQLVKDRMMAQKGKASMTGAQADAILKGTALGQPIVGTSTGSQSSSTAQGGLTKPPTFPSSVREWFGMGSLTPPPAPESAASAQQGEPKEGAIARDGSGNTIVLVNGQWLNTETMAPVQ